MGKWSDLTAQQKAAVIKFAMDNGVSDINSIRDTYNLYSAPTWTSEMENRDYDMAAAKAAGIKADYRGHYPDTFKKPNHVTFSTESMYSDPIVKGGTWSEDFSSFTPSEFQKRNWTREEMLEALKSQGDENVTLNYGEGGKIYIKPSKRGTFTAAATKHGKSVQEFARQVLANKENYSPAMVRKANFARNFGGHKKAGTELGESQFLVNDNIKNVQVWLNKGTKFQKKRPGTVNLQNITDKLNQLGPDIQYIWDDAEHNSYSAFRRNPDYRAPVIPAINKEKLPIGLNVSQYIEKAPGIYLSPEYILSNLPNFKFPPVTVSLPKNSKQNLKGNWIQTDAAWNPAYGYEIFHKENSPEYGIKYYTIPGAANAGQGSYAANDSTVMGISWDELNNRIFDYRTNHGGWNSFTTP